MGVKKIVAGRLDRARSFAEDVRAVYDDAYKKALEVKKGGLGVIVKEIEPKVRGAIDEGFQGAQTALDNLNQALADKAIPAFRKRAVSKEKLDDKAKGIAVDVATKAEPVKKKRIVRKASAAKKTAPATKTTAVKKKSTATPLRKAPAAKK